MKMTKRVFSLLFAVALLLTFATIPAFAAAPTSDGRIIIDNAGLFTESQAAELESLAKEHGANQDCDIIVYTTPDLAGYSAQSYADYCHIKNYNENSVLLLISVSGAEGDRDFHISTHGDCIKKLNDGELEDIKEAILPSLKSGDYYEAAKKYITLSDEYMSPHLKWYMLPLAIAIGFVIAMVIMNAIRKKLTTVEMQHGAKNYVRSGSMNVTASRDTYLYSTVTRTEKPKNNSSSTHSTGGDSFGGSGGKF